MKEKTCHLLTQTLEKGASKVLILIPLSSTPEEIYCKFSSEKTSRNQHSLREHWITGGQSVLPNQI